MLLVLGNSVCVIGPMNRDFYALLRARLSLPGRGASDSRSRQLIGEVSSNSLQRALRVVTAQKNWG
jgi:hypothetical protein